ncbi:MAG: type I asparaginase [Bacteroidales bacterium]|jgi:L-asparaginase|nr:type I asparaginase [Bacteroidales bacterium]
MDQKTSVLLILTGGTISMGEDPATGALAPLDKERMLSHLPELGLLPVNISVVAFDPMIDSSDVDTDFWKQIAESIRDRYDEFDGFVILHGTDTMAYSASAVSFMLRHLAKPVIFTGSQLPLGFLRSDAKENVLNAIEIAAAKDASGRPMVPEVAIFFENALMRGNRTTKKSTDNFDAFYSYNYPDLAKSGVHIKYEPHVIHYEDGSKPLAVNTRMDNNVVVFTLFPGIREEVVESLLNVPGLRAIILRTFGAGNAPRAEWLYNVLKSATDRGIVIVNISQCLTGTVSMGRYETSLHLQRAGVLSGFDMTLETAVTKLMHLLGNYSNHEDIVKRLQMPLCGEVTI